MLAASSGTALVRRGGVAVTVRSKEFDGGIKAALDREVGLLGSVSTQRLLHDARRFGRPILFIVDGYNECPADRQPQLTRAVAALARKFEAGVLVTSQIPLAKGDLLDLRQIDVSPPTMETKAAIAKQAAEDRLPREDTEKLLAAVSTGLEARLAGEVGSAVRPGISRFALFDAYARLRLGKHAGECVRALALVAAWMFERLVFSISVRDFDRVMDREGVLPALRRLILEKRLLMHRGDRVSFPHAMFFDAFAAEAVVRQAGDRPKEILKALAAPLHANRKHLVIGAIDDEAVLAGLLPTLEDSESVKACFRGLCGSRAMEWAEWYCGDLWIRLREEAGGVRFSTGSRGWEGVEFDGNSLTTWSLCDRACMGLVRQANWQKVGGASPPKRRSNQATFLREPCVGPREGAGEASVAVRMGRAIEHRKRIDPGCRGFQIGRRQHCRHRFGEMSADPAVSENPCTFARLVSGPWEVFRLPHMS